MANNNTKVTKTVLVQEIATKLGVSKAQAEKFINAFIDIITDSVKKGHEVTITGFGTFKKTTRQARQGVNPQTREKIEIPESVTVSFKAGRTLKSAM
jgi:DNA-binding protein HU-beta